MGTKQHWQRSGRELKWYQQCLCYLQGTSKVWRPRMWHRHSTPGAGEEEGPSNHRSSQRRKRGRGRVTGRESGGQHGGDWGWGLRSRGWMWGERGRQNGMENQKSLQAQLRGKEHRGEIWIMSSGSGKARQWCRAGVHSRVLRRRGGSNGGGGGEEVGRR